jgi:hypothetical protein
VSVAKTDGTAGTCTECWCLVEQGMERAHEDWHQKQNEILDRTLRVAGAALEDVARLRMKLLELEGKAP